MAMQNLMLHIMIKVRLHRCGITLLDHLNTGVDSAVVALPARAAGVALRRLLEGGTLQQQEHND